MASRSTGAAFAILLALGLAAPACAQEALSLQGLLDRGFEVKAAMNQGGGYEIVLQKEASVFVCSVLTTAFAGPKAAPRSQCARLSQK